MKIEQYIMIEDQFYAQLRSGDVLDLDIIDQKIKWLKKATLREVIMNFREKGSDQHMLFMAVER